jgi:prevent-host-death family protein
VTHVVGIDKARTHLSELVARVENGEEVVLTQSGKPVARLIRYLQAERPLFGALRGHVSDPSVGEWESLDAEFRAMFGE